MTAQHRGVLTWAISIIAVSAVASLLTLGFSWRHADQEIRKDQRSWCSLLADIQAPVDSQQPISAYGKRIYDAAREQYEEFGCRG
jgi:hypothetical protein